MDNITGLADFNAAIANLQANLKKQLPVIVAQAANTTEQEIESRMQVDTGEMKQSLEVVQTAHENSATATVQVSNSGKGANQHYAIFQEYGTSKMQARPFFRPGVEAAKDKVQAQLIDGVLAVVEQNGR